MHPQASVAFRWAELSRGLPGLPLGASPSKLVLLPAGDGTRAAGAPLCCPHEPPVVVEVFSESRFQPAAVETSSVS